MIEKAFVMTPESMEAFVSFEKSRGASKNMLGRFKAAVRSVYNFLPKDKQLTEERLVEWRADMEHRGYAYQTVQNYVKYLNRYLDYAGASALRFQRGKGKDISGMEFGYITAIEPTDKRDRKDIVWRCRCKCGTELELPATRLLQNNTLSCGCINREQIKRANKYFCGTSLEKSLSNPIISIRSISGYVGVTQKRGKWQAYITYKGRHISLGVYDKLEDAVKARAKGKEAVMEDAAELLRIYEEIHKNDEALPSKATAPNRDFSYDSIVINDQPTTAAKRSDNTSGYTGVTFRKNKWESRISYHKTRYMLGRFESKEDAIAARQGAEELLKTDPKAFLDFEKSESKRKNPIEILTFV